MIERLYKGGGGVAIEDLKFDQLPGFGLNVVTRGRAVCRLLFHLFAG
jgi:hypothetical protein